MPVDKKGSVRIEQLKLVAPHMTAFVDAMRSALQSRAWERSRPAESSGRSHTSASPTAVMPGSNPGAVDESLVDSQLVGMLVAMGFPKHRAARAAFETGNTGACHKLTVQALEAVYSSVACMAVPPDAAYALSVAGTCLLTVAPVNSCVSACIASFCMLQPLTLWRSCCGSMW